MSPSFPFAMSVILSVILFPSAVAFSIGMKVSFWGLNMYNPEIVPTQNSPESSSIKDTKELTGVVSCPLSENVNDLKFFPS